MSTEASPRPWLCMCGSDVNAVFAANGALVARVETAADAALIVDAVNGLRSEDAPAGFDPYCARHGCPNCRIYARLQEAKQKEESK